MEVATNIIMAIRRHPDPCRACAVVEDIMARISTDEDLEAIKAVYAKDLAIMKGEETV